MFGAQLRDLSTWMAAAGIDTLELTGPSVRLRLGGDAERPAADGTTEQHAAPEPCHVVTAPMAGHFLHHHPLQATALAAAGTQVRAGHIVGLLRVDMLLVPVLAPRDGCIGATRIPHGTLVGFGTGLIELQPIEREAQ